MLKISEALLDVGIKPNDMIVIHANAGVAAQLIGVDVDRRLNKLINDLVNFLGNNGTLVIPTFSYTFTKNENFDLKNTPSDIGTFSEACRLLPIFQRSSNPNFSFVSVGKYAEEIVKSRIDDCFGHGTAFDILYQYNAKLVCLGCDFSRITFAHYVEQAIGVSYRYLKSFSGNVIDGTNEKSIENTYYVRDLSIESQGELSLLKEHLIRRKLLGVGKYGRYPLLSISTHNFYSEAEKLIAKNPYALTQHRFNTIV